MNYTLAAIWTRKRRQAITWTTNDLGYMLTYASLDTKVLRWKCFNYFCLQIQNRSSMSQIQFFFAYSSINIYSNRRKFLSKMNKEMTIGNSTSALFVYEMLSKVPFLLSTQCWCKETRAHETICCKRGKFFVIHIYVILVINPRQCLCIVSAYPINWYQFYTV